MYKVVVRFKDLQDNGFIYNPGDMFPRDGLIVSKSRYNELASNKNKRGIPLIEEIMPVPEVEAEAEKPKRIRARKDKED